MVHPDLNEALLAAVSDGDVPAAEQLLTQGADPNYHYGGGVLVAAVEQGNVDMVRLLLRHGADPNTGRGWDTALHAAVSRMSPQWMIRLLLEHGADPNIEGYENVTPLLPAAGCRGSYDAVKALVAAGADVHHRCDDGDNALMWAAYQRHWTHPENPLEALLDAGADPNANNEIGGSVPTTALNWAAREGYWINVNILLARGADPNLVDCEGNTALHIAATNGYTRIVEALLKCGADPTVRDARGETARTLAERHCRELLEHLGEIEPPTGSTTSMF